MSRSKSKAQVVRVTGPLAACGDAYRSRLTEVGYSSSSQVNLVRVMAQMSEWLQARQAGVGDLNWALIEEYLAARRSAGYASYCSRSSIAILLDTLSSSGLLPIAPSTGDASWGDPVLDGFIVHLRSERGLAACTTEAYARYARRFLADCGGLPGVTPAAVGNAVLREAATRCVGSTQCFIAALRALLRYCFLTGLLETDVSASALWIAGRRRSQLPAGISAAQAATLLGSCDRRRAVGRRDYAVILLLLRLGLRAGEVAALSLDDIDWAAGTMTVHGKGRRVDELPLPCDVGEAVVAYLRRGRPRVVCRAVFLSATAPRRGVTSSCVSSIVMRAAARAGLPPVAAHRLRHTAACQMVRAGTPLAEIAAVLRHRDQITTTSYARVDVEQLRLVARPWPDGVAR